MEPLKNSLKQEMMMEEAIASAELAGAEPQTTWSERFDKEFYADKRFGINCFAHETLATPGEIKNFIAQEIKLAEEKCLRDILKIIGDWKPTEGYGSDEEKGFQKGIMASDKLHKKNIEKYAHEKGINLS